MTNNGPVYNHAEFIKAWRLGQLAKGLCTMCLEPLVPGRTYCAKHLADIRHSMTKRRQQRKAAGLCQGCGKCPPKRPGQTNCQSCLDTLVACQRRTKWGGNWLKALERDNYKCRVCGKTMPLTVHHIDGQGCKSSSPNHAIDNLITLCRGCHNGITVYLKYQDTINLVVSLLQAPQLWTSRL